MARRGENIRKRKDGRWEGRYSLFNPQSQKSVVRSVYAKSYSAVKDKLAAAKMDARCITKKQKGTAEVRFNFVAEEWLSAIQNSKKHATFVKYRYIYKKHIKEKLEGVFLKKLDQDFLVKAMQSDKSEELSESIQKSITCVLNQILTYAVSNYHVEQMKYSSQRSKKRNKPVEILNQTEQSQLLKYLYDDMDTCKMGVVICISTGLRLGEICSLKWQDVDLERKLLRVNSTVQRISVDGMKTRTILREDEPKSVFSKREIPLSDELVKLLISYHNTDEKYVIHNSKAMEPRSYQNKFHKYLETAGIEHKKFHSLWHTFATNCINSGVDVKSLSEILGHSDVKITLNRYVHPTIETKREHMNSLSAVYGQYLGQRVP